MTTMSYRLLRKDCIFASSLSFRVKPGIFAHRPSPYSLSTTNLKHFGIRYDCFPVLTRCFSSVQRKWNALSNRDKADLEECFSRRVGPMVIDPVVQQDLAALQWIHPKLAISEDGTLHVLLKLPSLLHPRKDELKELVKLACEQEFRLWASDRNIENSSPPKVCVEVIASKPVPMMEKLVQDKEELLKSLGPGLSSVSHFVAVYSCKGGVGKSTVAVNLAYELASQGGRVGLVDLDIYGPSLPVLVRPKDRAIRPSPKGPGMVNPIDHEGVKIMSLGFVNQRSGVPGSGDNNGASVMRGPMAIKVVAQLLKGTDWGDLDILLLDMPPGTGDVQLSVLQELQLSGAVAVTTPSKLATVDTAKGIEMFTSLGVPTLAVVANMSYFEVDGVLYFPFGRDIPEDGIFEKTSIIKLPISPVANDSIDEGIPFCLQRRVGAEPELKAFKNLSNTLSQGLLNLQYRKSHNAEFGQVSFSDVEGPFDVSTMSLELTSSGVFSVCLLSDTGAIQKRITPVALRTRDPKSGEIIPDSPFLRFTDEESQEGTAPETTVIVQKNKGKRSPSLIPTKVEKKGKYGYAVEWGDGATIIYSKAAIATAAGGVVGK